MKNWIVYVFFVFISFTSFEAFSKKLYKYQDNNGKWHYSDKKPSESSSNGLEEMRIKDNSEKKLFKGVWVRETERDNPGLTIINNYYGPVLAKLSVRCKRCTVESASDSYVELLVPGNSEKRAVNIEKQSSSWSADYNLSITLGDPSAKHTENYLYALPFPAEKYRLVGQGFNGAFSHQDEENKYAFDFALPIATPVLAVRDGVVMGIVEDYTEAGVSPKFADKANVVYILHDDGTISSYAHLDMFSAKVEPGQRVMRGDMLARSGNTGFSTGPHLHFTILKNEGGKQVSIPYQFDNGKGVSFLPIAGQEIMTKNDGEMITRVNKEHNALYAQGKMELNSLTFGNKEKSFFDKVSDILSSWLE